MTTVTSHYNSLFSIAALAYLILLYTVFVFKKKNASLENRLFSFLSIVTLFSIIVELFCDYGIPRLNLNQFWITFFEKTYLFVNVFWTYAICAYALLVSFRGSEDLEKKFRKYRTLLLIIMVIAFVVISFLRVDHFMDEELAILIYLQGPAVYASFSVALVYALIAFAFNIKFFINIRKKKNSIPTWQKYAITFVFIWGMLLALVQLHFPEVTLISFSQVVFVTIIYFFLENPDLDLVEQVDKAKNTAEMANFAKTNFLSSMSHEIRTPLNAIIGLSEHIKGNSNISDVVRTDIDDITNASRNLLEIIGNIIDINKIESDNLEINNVKYVFEDEFEHLIRIVGTRIGDKPITLNVNISREIPFELIGDKFHIKSIINNLLTNAIKYTERGKIDFNVSVTNIIPNDSCMLIFTVADTGVGIKSENIPKLFTKFERLDFEGNTKVEGTGLGLSITKKIVDFMGGKIEVSSTYGEGSTFTVYLPQKISKMECELTNTQRIDISAINERLKNESYSGKHVLIVDDNNLNLKVAKKAVEDFNFVIDECKNGEECLNKVNSGNKYDLILMDIMMPVMDGETAMKELKKIAGFDTPVIAVTADAIAGAKEKYLSEGFTDYIAKPYTKEQIKIRLDSVFRHADEFDKNN